MDDLRTILTGSDDHGLVWSVHAGSAPGGELATVVTCSREGRTASSGMLGPPIPPGRLTNVFIGSADGFPTFVLVRAVDRASAVTIQGTGGRWYPLRLTEVDNETGLRFAACPLDDADDVALLAVVLDSGDVVVETP
jgi:hypothetical protein